MQTTEDVAIVTPTPLEEAIAAVPDLDPPQVKPLPVATSAPLPPKFPDAVVHREGSLHVFAVMQAVGSAMRGARATNADVQAMIEDVTSTQDFSQVWERAKRWVKVI